MGKTFVVPEWTPVYLDWRCVLSSGDFLVSFSGPVLDEIEQTKNDIWNIFLSDKFFPISTEHWVVHISPHNMLFIN